MTDLTEVMTFTPQWNGGINILQEEALLLPSRTLLRKEQG